MSKSHVLSIRLDLSVPKENSFLEWYRSIPVSRRQEYLRNLILIAYQNPEKLDSFGQKPSIQSMPQSNIIGLPGDSSETLSQNATLPNTSEVKGLF